jgi:hypothetical protein
MLPDPFREVLAPFSTTNQPILWELLEKTYNGGDALTSSPSQLATRTVRKGFQPFLNNVPNPRTAS